MKLPYDEMRHVNGRDILPARALSKPERFELNNLQQRKISIGLNAPFKVSEISKAPAGAAFVEDTEKQFREMYNNKTAPVISVNQDRVQPKEPTDVLTTHEVGSATPTSCKWATVWVHGATPLRGGLGMNDTTFGAAFNRMKHLAQDNDGLYYSPTIQNFSDTRGLVALIQHIRKTSCPNGKIVLNCGSAGVSTCWGAANDKRITRELSGLVFIGGGAPYGFQNSEVAKERVPLLLAQGSRDHAEGVLALGEKMRTEDPSYPFRAVVFENGGHMTPLRMLDWKETMSCMLSQTPDKGTAASTSEGSVLLKPGRN